MDVPVTVVVVSVVPAVSSVNVGLRVVGEVSELVSIEVETTVEVSTVVSR